MAATEGAPAGVDAEVLTRVVRRALRSPGADVVEWAWQPIAYQQVWQTTGGVHRFSGVALDRGERRPWQLILKIAHSPAAASASGVLQATAEPGSPNYWKRE